MRSMAIMGLALATLLGVTTTQPAVAGDYGYPRGYSGADVYVHSHAYYPPRRMRQVYPVGRPGPLNVHVVTYGGAPLTNAPSCLLPHSARSRPEVARYR